MKMSRGGPKHAASGQTPPVLVRVSAFLLWLYPTRFRREYGDEMLRVLRDRVRDTRGPDAMVWLWGWALGDLLRSALAERARGGMSMERSVWVRLGGAAAMLSGLMALVSLLATAMVPGFSPQWGVVAVSEVGPLLIMACMVVLARQLRGRDRWLTRWLTGVGLALVVVSTLAKVVYTVATDLTAPDFGNAPAIGDIGLDLAQVMSIESFLYYVSLLLALGLVLLGIATLRGRPLRVGNVLPLLLGVLFALYYGSRFRYGIGDVLGVSAVSAPMRLLGMAGVAAYMLYFLGLIAFGVCLWRSAPRIEAARVASAG